jgi:hypothetical protein
VSNESVERRRRCRGWSELSVLNVDKLPLVDEDIVARLGQFPADQTVWLTRAATFIKKSRLRLGVNAWLAAFATKVGVARKRAGATVLIVQTFRLLRVAVRQTASPT